MNFTITFCCVLVYLQEHAVLREGHRSIRSQYHREADSHRTLQNRRGLWRGHAQSVSQRWGLSCYPLVDWSLLRKVFCNISRTCANISDKTVKTNVCLYRNITAESRLPAATCAGYGKRTTVRVTRPPYRSTRLWVRRPARPTALIRWRETTPTITTTTEGATTTKTTTLSAASVACTRTRGSWSSVRNAWWVDCEYQCDWALPPNFLFQKEML